jgi:hypothetical protein
MTVTTQIASGGSVALLAYAYRLMMVCVFIIAFTTAVIFRACVLQCTSLSHPCPCKKELVSEQCESNEIGHWFLEFPLVCFERKRSHPSPPPPPYSASLSPTCVFDCCLTRCRAVYLALNDPSTIPALALSETHVLALVRSPCP